MEALKIYDDITGPVLLLQAAMQGIVLCGSIPETIEFSADVLSVVDKSLDSMYYNGNPTRSGSIRKEIKSRLESALWECWMDNDCHTVAHLVAILSISEVISEEHC